MRIRVIGEGRTQDAHLRALEEDYRQRIAHFGEIVVEAIPAPRGRGQAKARAPKGGPRWLERWRASYKVVVDSRGREWTSQEFAAWLGERAVSGTREIAFLVGGPDGVSSARRDEADLLLSLSRLTLTHDWARVLLLEQIYRAYTILRGYPYPR